MLTEICHYDSLMICIYLHNYHNVFTIVFKFILNNCFVFINMCLYLQNSTKRK